MPLTDRQRAAQRRRAVADSRRRGQPYVDQPAAPAKPPPTLAEYLGVSDDLPTIVREGAERWVHPTWAKVYRAELHAGVERWVLIYEHQSCDRAYNVCVAQRYKCRVEWWNGRRTQAHINFKADAKVIEPAG